MKVITVSGLSIQFDAASRSGKEPKRKAKGMIETINRILAERADETGNAQVMYAREELEATVENVNEE